MKAPIPRTPKYCHNKSKNRAYVRIDGQWITLGRYGSPESHEAYDRLIAEWLTAGRRLPDSPDEVQEITVSEVINRFWKHAQVYYGKPDGKQSAEVGNFKAVLGELRRLYASTPAIDFGPLKLKALRQRWVDASGMRVAINQQTQRIKRMFKWAVAEEVVPARVYDALRSVVGLKRGRTNAREGKPVMPVPDEFVDAIQPFVSRQVWAAIELQRLTGMRSTETLMMRACDLDTTGTVWIYRPQSHKTEHYGYDRIVEIGPKAQDIIKAFLKRDTSAYLFSPREAEAERRASMTKQRKTPRKYGNRPGTNRKRKPKRVARDHYDHNTYLRTVYRGCDLADKAAKKAQESSTTDERIIPRWHPHQLRHAYATMIRKQYGAETARIMCGHKSMDMTEIYAEVDRTKAGEIALKIG